MEFWLFIWILNVWLTFISIIEFETCAENVPEKKRRKKRGGSGKENKESIWMSAWLPLISIWIETCVDEWACNEARRRLLTLYGCMVFWETILYIYIFLKTFQKKYTGIQLYNKRGALVAGRAVSTTLYSCIVFWETISYIYIISKKFPKKVYIYTSIQLYSSLYS